MKRINFYITILIAFIVVLILNIYSLFYKGGKNYFGIVSNLLFIIALISSIRDCKKTKN